LYPPLPLPKIGRGGALAKLVDNMVIMLFITLSEMALWQNLKGKKLFGFRFLRQHLIVYLVVDQECFYYVTITGIRSSTV
jgi:hypothetical protein